MRILLVHNRYLFRGGEDTVFEAETEMLRANGHEVRHFIKDNHDIGESGKLGLFVNTIWSRNSYRELRRVLGEFQPAVVHVHNTLPLISPAVYDAANAAGIPVVQTLHNFRPLCLTGQFSRNGKTCEDCLGKPIPYPGVVHACYRESRAASATVALMIAIHRGLGTWNSKVGRYIALTEFARAKFIAGGLPPEKIVCKPNFVPDPGPADDADGERKGMLFIGRISEEKGIDLLVDTWRDVDARLDVAGDGPLLEDLRRRAPANVYFHGRLEFEQLMPMVRKAMALVLPSQWFEGCPMVICEAFSAGLPVITSRLGGMAELVENGVSGLHFEPGDAGDLLAKVRWALANPEALSAMGTQARSEYEEKFSPGNNYKMLEKIYLDVIAENAAQS